MERYGACSEIIVAFAILFCLNGLFSPVQVLSESGPLKEKPETGKKAQLSPESVYTIQAGSFRNPRDAEEKAGDIEKKFEKREFRSLRVEKVGEFYAVRVGRFASLKEAESFFRDHRSLFEGALVMKAYFIKERIVMLRDSVMEEGRTGTKEVIQGVRRSVEEGRKPSEGPSMPAETGEAGAVPGIEDRKRIVSTRDVTGMPKVSRDLGLLLVGTVVADDPEMNAAVIREMKTGNQQVCREGEKVGAVQIRQVLSRSIVIDAGDGDELLPMDGGPGGGAVPSSGQTVVHLQKEEVDSMFPEYQDMMWDIRVRPFFQSGLPAGFMIYNIKAKSIFQRMGLVNGDVITAVNKAPVTTTEHALHFYRTLRQGGVITLDVRRDETVRELSFVIE